MRSPKRTVAGCRRSVPSGRSGPPSGLAEGRTSFRHRGLQRAAGSPQCRHGLQDLAARVRRPLRQGWLRAASLARRRPQAAPPPASQHTRPEGPFPGDGSRRSQAERARPLTMSNEAPISRRRRRPVVHTRPHGRDQPQCKPNAAPGPQTLNLPVEQSKSRATHCPRQADAQHSLSRSSACSPRPKPLERPA
eukprot:scaffold1142_cov387-Prasinococcus_capsulatus_cf.AAC.10